MQAATARIRLLMDQERYDMAEREARGALAAEPNNAAVHALLSLALIAQDRHREATQEAETAIGSAPDLPMAHVALGWALLGRNDFRGAKAAADEAIRLDPEEPSHLNLLANVHLANRRWGDALAAAERGLALDPDDAGCLRARTMAAAQLGQVETASITSAQALADEPDSAANQAVHGAQLFHARRFAEARASFREALRLDPTNDLARSGLIETIKAQNPAYRAFLNYSVWASHLGTGPRLLLLLGGPFLFRTLRAAFRSNPSTEWLLAPLVVLWAGVLLATWLAYPLGNLALRLHPLGRHALSEDDRLEASLIGLLLVGGVAGLVLAAVGQPPGLFAAVAAGVTAISTTAAFRADAGWPRLVLGAVALAVVVAGASAATLAFLRPEGISDVSPAWIPLYFAIGIAAVGTWLAQWLVRVQPRR